MQSLPGALQHLPGTAASTPPTFEARGGRTVDRADGTALLSTRPGVDARAARSGQSVMAALGSSVSTLRWILFVAGRSSPRVAS